MLGDKISDQSQDEYLSTSPISEGLDKCVGRLMVLYVCTKWTRSLDTKKTSERQDIVVGEVRQLPNHPFLYIFDL